jgi:hypothetical protein
MERKVPDIKFHALSPIKVISINFDGNKRCSENNEVNEDNLKKTLFSTGNLLLLEY